MIASNGVEASMKNFNFTCSLLLIFTEKRIYSMFDGVPKVEYAGREILHGGTTMHDEKTQKVLDLPLPEYVRLLLSFIDVAEYFRNHVYGNFSKVIQSLKHLASISENNKIKLKLNEVPQGNIFSTTQKC